MIAHRARPLFQDIVRSVTLTPEQPSVCLWHHPSSLLERATDSKTIKIITEVCLPHVCSAVQICSLKKKITEGRDKMSVLFSAEDSKAQVDVCHRHHDSFMMIQFQVPPIRFLGQCPRQIPLSRVTRTCHSEAMSQQHSWRQADGKVPPAELIPHWQQSQDLPGELPGNRLRKLVPPQQHPGDQIRKGFSCSTLNPSKQNLSLAC